jgi:ADP-heptose:LPS heptosyltransferase
MRHIRGAYSIAGLTQPKQVFPILRRSDLIITVDCFIMHAAHHILKPAVVLWGPTEPGCYGYPEHLHLLPLGSCRKPDGCIIPGKGENYDQPCPIPDSHCVDTIGVDAVIRSHFVERTLKA